MKAHEKRLVFERLTKLADELELAPKIAEAASRRDAAASREKYPDLAERGYYSERNYPLEVGYLQSNAASVAGELRALVKAFGPKAKRASKVALVALAALVLAGCGVEQPDDGLPYCADIGAPDTLLCRASGVCTWQSPEGPVECCARPAPGREPAPECAADASNVAHSANHSESGGVPNARR